MIKTQIARRNLTQMQHTLFRGMHYVAEKRIQGRPKNDDEKGIANKETAGQKTGHSDQFFDGTAERLGNKYNVSPVTIRRDARAAAGINAIGEVSSPAKIKVLEEATDITRKQLRDLATDLLQELDTLPTGNILSFAQLKQPYAIPLSRLFVYIPKNKV